MMHLNNMIRGTVSSIPSKLLLQLWEHDAGTLKFWRASSNFVYTFERDGARYFLRYIHEEDNTTQQIEAELDFILYLIGEGFPAAVPVRSRNGQWMETIETEHGRYFGTVFEQAKGSHIPLEQMSDGHLTSWGKALASLHHLSEKYRPETPSRKSWEDALTFISSVLQRYPKETVLSHELSLLRKELQALPGGEGLTGLIHYDFETDNMFYSAEEAQFYAIDFDDAMVHWFIMDVTSAISDLLDQEGREEAMRQVQQFLAGYRSIKPLDEFYIDRIPLFRKFADLYTFARLLRSVEGMDETQSPEWAITLRDKLLRICDQIRERHCPAVRLAPIDHNNWHECTLLEVTDEQKNVFPVPAVYWLAESAYCGFTPLAIYSGEQLIGFTVYAVDQADGAYWIMAYMIDHRYQNKRFGKAGMIELIQYMRGRHSCGSIFLGHRPGNERAAHLYASLGFRIANQSEQEIIRELSE
ncbi:GNAT family N-acetyltransferase [Paenibacillus harenae]|uniref:Bifunctional AAC/APH n=1 Tax=Paenibacillus harenae TaxID=306543 RepID=A0ABT9U8R0_PAEHA|nr:GNAT family N-acetyltransferase [Paenibacillus harenae]MDQ0116038.1 Ser/Thr protein kinase RdoA (MazF antagonist)/ribosomal protein S18 acetylase RimI-like enzyme [Paenibacillus harenae]